MQKDDRSAVQETKPLLEEARTTRNSEHSPSGKRISYSQDNDPEAAHASHNSVENFTTPSSTPHPQDTVHLLDEKADRAVIPCYKFVKRNSRCCSLLCFNPKETKATAAEKRSLLSHSSIEHSEFDNDISSIDSDEAGLEGLMDFEKTAKNDPSKTEDNCRSLPPAAMKRRTHSSIEHEELDNDASSTSSHQIGREGMLEDDERAKDVLNKTEDSRRSLPLSAEEWNHLSFRSVEYTELENDTSSVGSEQNGRKEMLESTKTMRNILSKTADNCGPSLPTERSGCACCSLVGRETRQLALICASMFFLTGAWQSFNICATGWLPGCLAYGKTQLGS